MSFTNCENMTTYATNEYAINTSLSKFRKVPLCKSNPKLSTMYVYNEYVFHRLSKHDNLVHQ